MNAPTAVPPLLPEMRPPASRETLRRLFLTLFLRGRSARGLQKEGAPKSVGQKLLLTLLFYGLFGSFASFLIHQPVFALSIYLHAMTLVFVGMFVASASGEVLFNKEEADILLHRPIEPRVLLWSKIRVLVEVSLWLAGAFNLVGLFLGLAARDGSFLYPLAHAISTALEACFCVSCVVLIYQICLRWFGRERLDGIMTTAQVLVSITAVVGGQVVPRLVLKLDHVVELSAKTWWLGLLPPAWFAGFDVALAGKGGGPAWILAAAAVVSTAVTMWAAFDKLAGTYQSGLQTIGETVSSPVATKRSGRILNSLFNRPPLTWWLRRPVERAAFLLVTAYLVRDRDVKLRLYPGVAPMLIFPIVFLVSGPRGAFGPGMAGGYMCLIPLMAIDLLQYSQQWQAADIFRVAPQIGPAAICHGARRAVLLFLTLPMVLAFLGITLAMGKGISDLILFLPGLIALPVFAIVPQVIAHAVPLSRPTEDARSAGRGLKMVVAMLVAMPLGIISSVLRNHGWFWIFVAAEVVVAGIIYFLLRRRLDCRSWPSIE